LVCIEITGVPSTCTIRDIAGYGGRVKFTKMSGNFIENIRHSDRVNGTLSTSQSSTAFDIQQVSDIIIKNITLAPGGVPSYKTLVDLDPDIRGMVINGVDYDGQNHIESLGTIQGLDNTFANINLGTTRTSSQFGNSTALNAVVKNYLTGSNDSTGSINLANAFYEFVQASKLYDSSNTGAPDAGHFNVLINNAKTSGSVQAGPWGKKINGNAYTIVSGDVDTDGNGGILLPTSGDEVILNSQHPIRGVTAFQNVAPHITGDGLNLIDVEFEVVNTGGTFAGVWTTLDGPNLSTALSSLSGFDSDVGFDMRIRVAAHTSWVNTHIDTIQMYCDTDATYSPVTGEANVTITGMVDGSAVALFDASGASDVLAGKTILSGATSAQFTIPYEFDGNPLAYRVRVRKPGYNTFEITGNITGKSNTVPISQVEKRDIVGSAIYGRGDGSTTTYISLDYTDKRIDIGDGLVTAEDLFNYVSEQLATLQGIEFGDIVDFDGRDILLLNSWLFRRNNAGDTNAGLDAVAIVDGDTDASPDDEVNGQVDFRAREVRSVFSTENANAIAAAVWDKLASEHTTAGTFGSLIKAPLPSINSG
jgi:hypothetical protein